MDYLLKYLQNTVFKKFLFSLLVITCWATALAENFIQAQNESLNKDSKFEILGQNDRPVTLPFELINNLIIIEASINGSVPLKFILDTGVGNTLITSLPNGEEIYLKSSRTVSLSGLGEGEPVEAFYSDDNLVNIGESIQGKEIELLFLKDDIFKLSSFMGTFVHGIIGYDLFASFAVEINYINKQIILYDTEEFKNKFDRLPRNRKWAKIPIFIDDKKPYVEVDFKHKGGESYIPLRLLIDSGSSNAFSLYKMTHEEITVPKLRINTLIGVGLSGKVNGQLGRVKKMRIGGNYRLDEPVIAYPDSFAIRRAFTLGDRNGSLGGEVLRRFKIIFHYEGGYILLRENRDSGENFNYNVSGIEVNTPVPNIPLYVVSEVREGSPAEIEGIMKGDVIKYINGKAATTLELNEVINYLEKKKGSRLRIEVQRDSLYMQFRFRLGNELKVDE
jgi:hypothetical protein